MADVAQSQVNPGHDGQTRRDFLLLTATALGAVGVATTIWPFIDGLNRRRIRSPRCARSMSTCRRSSRPADHGGVARPAGVDIAPHAGSVEGAAVGGRRQTVARPRFDGRPAASLRSELAPLGAARISRRRRHLHPSGCIPLFQTAGVQRDGRRLDRRLFLPVSRLEIRFSGRVFDGVPAPYNLPVPPYHFTGKTSIRSARNPPDSDFDFASIEQI